MNRRTFWQELWIAALVVTPHLVRGEQIPEPGVRDERIRTVVYVPGEVYRLQGFAGYAIHVEFAAGETFEGLGAGDMEAVSFVAQSNHLFLKPKVARVATNLTLLTNRRTYFLDYTVTGHRPDPQSHTLVYSLSFVYPEDTVHEALAVAEARTVNAALVTPAPRPVNDHYSFCGARSLRPSSASDDGISTRLVFPPRVDLPAVFLRNDDGSTSLVNFTVQGDGIMIHRVAKAFVLKRGKLSGCVINQHFEGGGASLDSGTISATVERKGRGESP